MNYRNLAKVDEDEIRRVVARRITHWRTQAKMSKSQLAEKAGRTRGEITNWESGKFTPSITNICRLAVACGVLPSTFLFGGKVELQSRAS